MADVQELVERLLAREAREVSELGYRYEVLVPVNPDGPEAAATITDLTTRLAAAEAREARLREALEFIADMPDPGAEKERSATFYSVHAAMLKQIAAKAIGRETVSPEAFAWAEEWANSEEGRAALAGKTPTRSLSDFLAHKRQSHAD